MNQNQISSPETLETALIPTDPDMRARYLQARERKLAIQALETRCLEFRALVQAGDYTGASKLFLDASGDSIRLEFLRSLEFDEPVLWYRASTPKVQAAIMTVHPCPGQLRREVVLDVDLPRYVRIERGTVGGGRALISATSRREVDQRTYQRLVDAGVACEKRHDAQNHDVYFYSGLNFSDALMNERLDGADGESEVAFSHRLSVDPELCAMISSGKLVVRTLHARGPCGDCTELAKLKASATGAR